MVRILGSKVLAEKFFAAWALRSEMVMAGKRTDCRERWFRRAGGGGGDDMMSMRSLCLLLPLQRRIAGVD